MNESLPIKNGTHFLVGKGNPVDFIFKKSPDGKYFEIYDQMNKKILGFDGGLDSKKGSDWYSLNVWDNPANDSNRWILEKTIDNQYTLKNVASGFCMVREDVSNSLKQTTCNNSDNQQWVLTIK